MDGQAKRGTVATWTAVAGLLAGPLFACALVGFAAALPGYRHALHAPALLGATGIPGAAAWNLVGFGLAGALAACALHGLYRALREDGAGPVGRIGATLLVFSALAFAAQGLFPLDLSRPLDAGPGRLHVAAWTLWWIAACAGLLVLAPGVAPLTRWRSLLPTAIATAVLMLVFLHADVVALGAGQRQRLALAAWFAWLAWASWLALRRALSRSAA